MVIDREAVRIAMRSSRRLRNNVKLALVGVRRQRHRERLQRLAVYLHHAGFLANLSTTSFRGSPRRIVRNARRSAVEQLRCAGLLPTGFLSYFVFRFIVTPFLSRLIENWLWGWGDEK